MSSHFSSFIMTCVIILNMEDFFKERLGYGKSFLEHFKGEDSRAAKASFFTDWEIKVSGWKSA